MKNGRGCGEGKIGKVGVVVGFGGSGRGGVG